MSSSPHPAHYVATCCWGIWKVVYAFFWGGDAGKGQERVGRENGELGFPRLVVGNEKIRNVTSEVRFSWKQSLRQDPRVHDLLKTCSQEKAKGSG